MKFDENGSVLEDDVTPIQSNWRRKRHDTHFISAILAKF